MSWYNSDGILVKYGTEESVPAKAGHYVLTGPSRMLEIKTGPLEDYVDANAIVDDYSVLPEGALIEKIVVITTEAATGPSAVLDLGLVDLDRSSNPDDDALIVAAPVADFAAIGNTVTYTQGSDEHGASVGTVLTGAKLITLGNDTANFTAGELTIQIYYSF